MITAVCGTTPLACTCRTSLLHLTWVPTAAGRSIRNGCVAAGAGITDVGGAGVAIIAIAVIDAARRSRLTGAIYTSLTLRTDVAAGTTVVLVCIFIDAERCAIFVAK